MVMDPTGHFPVSLSKTGQHKTNLLYSRIQYRTTIACGMRRSYQAGTSHPSYAIKLLALQLLPAACVMGGGPSSKGPSAHQLSSSLPEITTWPYNDQCLSSIGGRSRMSTIHMRVQHHYTPDKVSPMRPDHRLVGIAPLASGYGPNYVEPMESGSEADSTHDGAEDPVGAPAPPYVTIGILVVITAIFVAMYIAGHGDVTRVALQFGAKDNALIRQGQYWRLVTPIFLHGGWLHLLVNGYSLYRFGGSMERIFGPRKYLILFIFAGITGNMLSFLLSPTLSLGASGALFGLVGAGLVFPLRFRNLIRPDARSAILRQLTAVAVINLAIGFSLQGIIDNWAHIGGLAGGAFAALFLIPDALESEPRSRLADALVSGVMLLLTGVVVASWFLQWKNGQQTAAPSYYPAAGPAWWSVRIPERWRYANGYWKAPDGATIHISDQRFTDSQTGLELQKLLTSRRPLNTELDGRPGWYDATPRRLEYRIPVYDRLFELILDEPSGAIAPAASSDFAEAAKSVRFIRPPYGN